MTWNWREAKTKAQRKGVSLANEKTKAQRKGVSLANEKTKAQRKAWVWQMKKRKRSHGRQHVTPPNKAKSPYK
jgi:hypothetical protein